MTWISFARRLSSTSGVARHRRPNSADGILRQVLASASASAQAWIGRVQINELADDRYPGRKLFTLLREANPIDTRSPKSPRVRDPQQFLRFYGMSCIELKRV